MKNSYYQDYFTDDEVILVTGSLNANKDDQYMSREEIRPVQLIMDNEIIPVRYFDAWGEYGASSFAWSEEDEDILYFTTGDTPYQINLENNEYESLEIKGLKDVHEIEMIEEKLWLSNTGRDEAVEVDLLTREISQRVSLNMLKDNKQINIDNNNEEDISIVEKFHCNQITTGYDNQLWALVHHTSGEQVIRKVANKLIKNQGNGGVINLNNGEFINLKLKSPHSIRKIDGNYWVFDSGNSRLHIYDASWELIKKVNTAGFARGSDVTQKGVVCVGISETRKRYLNLIKGGKSVPNMVQFFSGLTTETIGEIVIPDIEQVNNIYIINRTMAKKILSLH